MNNQKPVSNDNAATGLKVRLKSGGPEMTLLQRGADNDTWLAQWDHEGTRNVAGFKLADLVTE